MTMNVGRQIATLKRMTVAQLRARHIEIFGEPTRSGHKEYLVKRIAWRLQARQRASELANDADLRTHAPRQQVQTSDQPGITRTAAVCFDHDPRVPMPGSFITRRYKDRDIAVKVLPKGFECEGDIYRTLSAVAKAVTGKHWNGYHFFNLGKNGKCT